MEAGTGGYPTAKRGSKKPAYPNSGPFSSTKPLHREIQCPLLWSATKGWSIVRHMPSDTSIQTPRVAFGLALWLFGWINVIRADSILINLRKPGETGYKIP